MRRRPIACALAAFTTLLLCAGCGADERLEMEGDSSTQDLQDELQDLENQAGDAPKDGSGLWTGIAVVKGTKHVQSGLFRTRMVLLQSGTRLRGFMDINRPRDEATRSFAYYF